MPIHQNQFLGSNANVCVTYSINASFSIIITNFQQKYVVLTAIRRSGGISKILLIKKLKSKVYVSFQISLYLPRLVNVVCERSLIPMSQPKGLIHKLTGEGAI